MSVLTILYVFLEVLIATTSAQSLSSILAGQAQLGDFASALEKLPSLNNAINFGNVTVLAPTNEVFAAFRASNPLIDGIHALLPYHVLHGLHTSLSINSTQFIPTLLDNSTYANVTSSQRVEANQTSNGNITFYSAVKVPSTITTLGILLTKGFLHIVDAVLQVPLPLSQTVSLADLPYFKGLLQQGGAFSGQALAQIVEVELLTNVTYFGVNSLEFGLNYTGLQNLTQAEILNLASYMTLDGTVACSTLFTDGATFQTQQGGNVIVTVASDGTTYLNDAMVIQKDSLIDNRVMQILDRILDPNNPSARPHIVIEVASTGVKAGAGVAVMIAFLIIIAAAVYFCMRTRRNQQARIARIALVHSIDNQPYHTAPSELSHDEWRRELPQEPDKYELGGNAERAIELQALSRPPVELDSRSLINGQYLNRGH